MGTEKMNHYALLGHDPHLVSACKSRYYAASGDHRNGSARFLPKWRDHFWKKT